MANRIKELRLEKKITQLQLSISLEVTQETISAYEHDRYLPSLSALIKMSEIFEVSMDYIMGMSDIRQIPTDYDINSPDFEQRNHLLCLYQKLGNTNKLRLLSYAQGLLDASQK